MGLNHCPPGNMPCALRTELPTLCHCSKFLAYLSVSCLGIVLYLPYMVVQYYHCTRCNALLREDPTGQECVLCIYVDMLCEWAGVAHQCTMYSDVLQASPTKVCTRYCNLMIKWGLGYRINS